MASAVKIRNNANGLCLDVPAGLTAPNPIKLAECCQMIQGDWTIVKWRDLVTIKSMENTTANGGKGCFLDYYPLRSGTTPGTYLGMYDTPAQQFYRDVKTIEGAHSFMNLTSQAELAVLLTDVAGSLANFGPIEASTAKRVRFEWTIIN
ncbi:hypothetical protein BGZ96_002563 [Linnemannia gamsii]|uniref:Uncharacterized protein n=1 Tax=Linnemannia gamsii TaxID=64522 RepID=A0ABQ7K7W3_9FUNG|nr:hypothetical protein BGZ96_002563 [Linnemannia gamsii]